MWLTLLALRNGIAILMASFAIVVLGATSLGRMPIDLFPNINYPSIRIGTIYKGANVQDIERTVTYPIEKAVSAVSNVRYVESRSRQGLSVVEVFFAWGADLDAGVTRDIVGRRARREATLRPRLQYPRAAARAPGRSGLGQCGRRQDPADHGQPEPRPPVLQGHLGHRGGAGCQRRELSLALG